MERALKYTFISLIAIVVVAVGFVYGLYFAGARQISPEWQPTTATYPEAARHALWRSHGGAVLPTRKPITPLGYAWRFVQLAKDLDDRKLPMSDPSLQLASHVARFAPLAPGVRGANHHLMRASATIRASHWPVSSQLDTMLDSAYFGGDTRGLRNGALRVYGGPFESIDEAQLHVLIAMMQGPGYFDPWCHRDRLRKRVLETATIWRVTATAAQLEAALASISPPPMDSRCAGVRVGIPDKT